LKFKRQPRLGRLERHAAPSFVPRLAYARSEAGDAQAAPEQAPRLLIVEDDFLVASQLEGALLDAGFVVVGVAANAEEAIAFADKHRPLLAIMDIHLIGRRDGIETAIELFASFGIRSIFATAHHDVETRERARPAQPVGWLPKPYTARAIVRIVRDAVSQLGDSRQ
jgi:DNA-binding NarL/FixJ family response regulator